MNNRIHTVESGRRDRRDANRRERRGRLARQRVRQPREGTLENLAA
jgi:hypothetical protein